MAVSRYEGDWSAFREQIYQNLRSSFIADDGDSTFPTEDASTTEAPEVSVWQALLWAIATALAQAQEQLERAGSNADPALALELLGMLERDYQVVPAYGATLRDRQSALALRARVARGASRPAIEAALTEMLGADFIAYETNPAQSSLVSWPASPGSVGVFDVPGAERKIFRIKSPISKTGSPVTVGYEVVGDSNPPASDEVFCCDPNARSPNIEQIRIQRVSSSMLTATFSKPHPAGTLACRPHPVWTSNQRVSRVVLTLAAATSPRLRAKVNDYLSRALRGVSTWSIVSNEGSFLLGHPQRGLLGATALGATPPL